MSTESRFLQYGSPMTCQVIVFLWSQKQVAFRLHEMHFFLQVGACMISLALQTVVLRRRDATFAENGRFT